MKQLRFATVLFFTFLIGIPLMAQENNTKCVMIKTSQGETLEYYISSHPRFTQNNDKVTLTTDDETLEFGTIGIKKVYTSIATVKVVYMLDGEVYKTYYHHAGVKLKSEPAPTKEGYNFSGWSNEPTIMPDHNVTVTGSMSINKYQLTYMVDGEEYKSYEVKYGATITAEAAPIKEGYTFSGWSEIPSTMPAHDVTVTGTFTVNKYKLTYMVDGEEFKTSEVEYGTAITAEADPTREGYTFSGWSEIPETMPAHDVTVTGTFTINKYKLTYMVDGEEFKTSEVEYGTAITAEDEPTKEGYTFSGWSEIPSTMPAHDVTVTGTFTINKYKLTYMVDAKEYKTSEVEYATAIIAEDEPTKEGYTFSGWSEIPSTMPAHDVTVTGTFTVNKYTITYMIDDEIYQTESVDYGSTIIPPSAPEREGCIFEWIDVPETMPAHDITIKGSYTAGIGGIYSESIFVSSENVLYLSGLKPGESVSVYNISGKLMLLEKASAQGDLSIPLSSLTQNVYIIKTNSRTFKVSRK